MKKILNRKIFNKALCLILSAVLTVSVLPADIKAAPEGVESNQTSDFAESNEVLSVENEYTSVHMLGTNGGFYISNREGDKTVKSDNNKDLLYHNDEYDTSFTSFKITRNGETKNYIFGEDYSYEGIKTSKVRVSKDAKGLSAVWTLGELEFTQRLELANSGSNEHGMVLINYDVKNNGSDDVKIEARILLDSAIGNQDYAYYYIPKSSYSNDILKKECILKANEIPATFYAYDDVYNPSATACTVISSQGMLKQIAFAHWNSLASTDFDFAPNESLNFTNDGNEAYGTADSAMAMYYDLGTINGGKEGIVNTYYGVYSNEKTDLNKDTVTFNMSSPSTLELSKDGKNYVSNCNRNDDGSFKDDGIFSIRASLKNISEKEEYKKIVVAVYASEGITPLDEHQQKITYETNYSNPYQSEYVDFKPGTDIKIPFYFKADVDSSASYRKITFRVFNLPNDMEENLLYENMLYEGSMYILCPGGNGKLPEITFNSATPRILYNDLSRHLYVTGTNFSMLEDKTRYTLYAVNEDGTEQYEIPSSNITVYSEENKLDILFDKKMVPDTYKLKFEWTEPPAGVDKETTGDALQIVMSDDIKYRNDYYGVLAVVQEKGTTGDDAKYDIKSYSDEDTFEKDKGKYEEVLLTFKGSFIKDDTFDKGTGGKDVKYVAKSIQGEKDKVVINGCIDAFDGTVTLSKVDGDIKTDFDEITLNASVENTRIYKGNAGFTTISDGEEYGLVPYNTDGEEISGFGDETITLVYPTALNGLMTIAGMAFNLSFARMGMMYDTDVKHASQIKQKDAKGYVMSFSARLDLSFLVPLSKRGKTTDRRNNSKYEIFSDMGAKAENLREEWAKVFKKNNGTSGGFNDDEDEGETQASVEVKNVLYGMNQGFIGVNFEAEVKVPGYTASMPNIEGKLKVNTINDWSFGVEGKASFLKSIKLEISLGFKSKNNIPIVDNLYFYVQGVKPGINIDSAGVCWLLGGGGGFENMYDTLFCCSEVPPIKLLLSVSFSLFQALDARADLSLGLTGFGIKVSDLKVANTDIKIMDYAKFEAQWIPYTKVLAQCSINYLQIIEGKGYIVIDGSTGAEEAFEAYAQAAIKIPDFIPLIGGIDVGGAALGINTKRIWGALRVLGFSTGISYAYGGDLSFGSQVKVEPTYPQYLEEASNKDGLSGKWYAVRYDEEKQDMLYMNMGANIHEVTSSSGNMYADNNGNASSSLHSDITKTYHDFVLGNFEDGGAQVLSMAFSADTLEEANKYKDNLKIADESKKNYDLKYYDNSKSDEENEDANANFTYDEDKKEGTVVVSFTDKSLYGKKYTVNTDLASELILYAVDPLPEVTKINTSSTAYSNENNNIELTWNGNSKMSELEQMDIYIVDNLDVEKEGGTPIASLNKADIAKGKATIKLPETLTGGKYYIRAVYSKENVTTGVVSTETSFEYTNNVQPDEITNLVADNAGDLQIRAAISNVVDNKCEGALFKVYKVNEQGKKTEISDYNVSATRNENNEIFAVLGGSCETGSTDKNGKETTEKEGLKAGEKYVIGATPFNKLTDSKGNLTGLTYGKETFSKEITLNNPSKPEMTITADKEKYQVGRKEFVKDDNDKTVEKTVMYDTYKSSTIGFTVASDMNISGTWIVDEDEKISGTFSNTKSVEINLSELNDGDHTITVYGKNEKEDGFNQTFTFDVDTTAPTLLLTSPTNGSGFEESGVLKVSGITDEEALLTINVEGIPVARDKTLKELGATIAEDGNFEFNINVGSGYYSKEIEIIASDEIGNGEKVQCVVYNNGMGNVKNLDVALSADTTDNPEKEWVSYSNKNLYLGENSQTGVEMQVCAITNDNNKIILNRLDNVDWNIRTISGKAKLEENKLTLSKGAHGFVEGRLNLDDGAALSTSFTFGAEVLGQQEENEGYKMTYDANGGKGAMTDPNSPYKENASVLVAGCGFSRDGYTFVEWNTKSDGSGTSYLPGDKFYIKSDVKLYAIWKKSPNPDIKNDVKEDNGTAKIGSIVTIGNAKYKVTSKDIVTYMCTTSKKAKSIKISDTVTIKGSKYKVTVIASGAFKKSRKLKSVIIGKNVVSIEKKAFYKIKTLKKIIIKSTKISKIGRKAFKGINKKALFKVPKKAKKKYIKKLNAKTGFIKKKMKIK